MGDVAVEICGLVKRFGSVVAVDHLDLAVEAGEFLSLLGPSGCGKTTTLRMIGGLDAPSAGTIRIAGQDVTSVPANRRPTSIVFQDYALFPHMSVRDNVAFGLKMRGVGMAERRRRAEAMLETVNLAGLGDRKPRQLSGGQRQRVALARSLVVEPDVLLLDEPLGALDALIRRQMQSELRRLQQSLGLTFLYVTHDQEEAMAMSDRLIVMQAGRIAQGGSPEQVYRRPATEFVARFLGECNLFAVTIVGATANRLELKNDAIGRFAALPEHSSSPLDAGPRLAAIRPEDVRIVPLDAGRLGGRVAERSYLGARTRFVVATERASFVVVADERDSVGAGDVVGLDWTDEAVALVAPEPTGPVDEAAP